MTEPGDQALVRKMMTIAAVSSEMCGPIVMGLLADHWLGWMPALTIVGAVLGLIAGIYRLVQLNRPKAP